mmetsp:Transcript_9021/g.17193  ORF Transcript_9021/g.17193 Transcript_9021/m.17193 type:complete len:137 (+) Transcript_9021:2-412(+)
MVLGKFTQPVLKEKIKTPTASHVGVKHHADGLGKFEEPVLKETIKTPTASHIGVKHHADGLDKFMQPVLTGKIKTPTTAHVGVKHHATGASFFQAPAASKTNTLLDTASRANIAPPKGKFKWVMVNGVYKKQQQEQ